MRHYTNANLPHEREIIQAYYELSEAEQEQRRTAYIDQTMELRSAMEALREVATKVYWDSVYAPGYKWHNYEDDKDRETARKYYEYLDSLANQYRREIYQISLNIGYPGRFGPHPLRPVK